MIRQLFASLARIAAALLLLALLCIAYLLFIATMPGTSHRGALPSLTTEEQKLARRLRSHVLEIASVEHNIAQPQQLEAAAIYLETELASYVVGVEHVIQNLVHTH